jgi:hypothetical protein
VPGPTHARARAARLRQGLDLAHQVLIDDGIPLESVAKAAAQLSHRFGLPAVFGELLLGLVLGPSLLGWLLCHRGLGGKSCGQSSSREEGNQDAGGARAR